MRTNFLAAAAAIAALVLAVEATAVELMADNNIGRFRVFYVLARKQALTDPQGRTLYTFARDDFETSTCIDACAQEWPPVAASPEDRGGFESFSVFIRPDGSRQWAYQGKPLYRSARDQESGQANGEGADGAWHIVEIQAHDM